MTNKVGVKSQLAFKLGEKRNNPFFIDYKPLIKQIDTSYDPML
jgi:hypothetical protein